MTYTILTYTLPSIKSRADILKHFELVSGGFKNVNGLIRKYFGYNESSGIGKSIYLWDTKEKAKLFYSEKFISMFINNFGVKPDIEYVDTLLIVDNLNDSVNSYENEKA
ncbi:hypothetical protein [Dickeya zeae]|uniref:hypothetical protein n=1 Tax=Dickeya zeae TaxID=204042 RepID=UPI001443758B|nr:hypothetical protein [Dickeya zeae]